MDIKRIVLLGLDGSGKTSLGKYLSERWDITCYKDAIYKRSFFGKTDYTFGSGFGLLQYFAHNKFPVIFDRWFWDEAVYGVAMKRGVNLKLIWEMDELAAQAGFKIVYLQKVFRKVDDLIDPMLDFDLKRNYDLLLASTQCPVLRLPTDDENSENQANIIDSWLA